MLTFSFSSKEMRAEDPLARVRSRLEPLDIKTIIPYLVEHTTHVVQSKRNTAKGLQALINGKYIVQSSYIDALVYATSPSDLENEESLSPLEIDYESAWPDPTEHLPPPGNEPVSRASAAFAPNPARVNVFEGYTFVFGDSAQFANLQAAINNGQGKALLFEVKDGVTTATEIVRFTREVGNNNDLDGDSGGPGVVLVRFRSKGEYEPWSIELGNEVALMTDRRVIEQREFLDAILENDASPLCRPLPREEGSSQASFAETIPESVQPTPERDVPSTSPPARTATQKTAPGSKAPRVRPFVSKMKAFDDGFDMESVPTYAPEEDTNTQAMDLQSQQLSDNHRPMDTMEEGAEEEMVSDLLPGTRAMKRRREEMGEDDRNLNVTRTKEEAAPKTKRPKLDILEAARKHREEEEQQRLAEENQEPTQDVNVEELKNMAIVEEMEMPVRQPPVQYNESSDRWDERWNGRKNFKRFRRKGEPRNPRQLIQSVIVPLEEVTRRDYGIGEHYWVSSNNNNNKTPEVSQSVEREERPSISRADSARSRSAVSPAGSPSRDPTPEPRPALSRARSQKRPRQPRDSDSDEELRFRFRRKR